MVSPVTSLLKNKYLTRLMELVVGKYVTIYMVHRAHSKDGSYVGLSPDLLDKYLTYAKQNNFEFASVDELVDDAINNRKPLKNKICFTLDDGYEDQALELVPVLLKHNAKPTLFVLPDVIDGIIWPWDAKISYLFSTTTLLNQIPISFNQADFLLDMSSPESRVKSRRKIVQFAKTLKRPDVLALIEKLSGALQCELPSIAPEKYRAVSWDQLRHYEALGLNIGSHACSHFLFNSLEENEVSQELAKSILRLKMELKKPSNVFCYPSGTKKDYSTIHTELVKNSGYKAAVSANPGNSSLLDIKHDLFNITRHGIPQSLNEYIRYSSWVEVIRTKLSK